MSDAILEVKNSTKIFGGLVANEDISFDVERNSIVGVVGPNGAGKTTLFNSISRNHDLSSGKIIFDKTDITKLKPHNACKLGMGRTFQIPMALESMTVLENILVGALLHFTQVNEASDYAKEISEFCGLSHLNSAFASSLNVIQKKRLEIARALATKPKLLLLDEVMAGLTRPEQEESIELIYRMNEKGISILLIEHVMRVVMRVSSKVVVIVSGKKLTEATPDEVSTDERVIQSYLGGGKNASR